MNRRILGALTGAVLVAGALGSQLALPRTVLAASCSAPHVSSVSPALTTPGAVVTVMGSGFTCAGQGNGTSIGVGGSGQSITALSDSEVQFKASGAAGSVVVTVSYPVLLGSTTISSNTERLLLMVPAAGNSTQTPGPGGGFTVTGSGFSMGQYVHSVSASACGIGLPVTTNENGAATPAVSDTAIGLQAPGTYCDGGVALAFTGYATSTKNATILTNTVSIGGGAIDVAPSAAGLTAGSATPGETVTLTGAGFGTSGSATLNGAAVGSSWSNNAISFVVQPGSTSGPVVFTRSDGHVINGGNLTVVSQITSVSVPRAQAGDQVTIGGAGFGPSTGAVSIGGTAVGVKSWSPTSIVVTIPGNAASGAVTVTPQGNGPSTAGSVTIEHLSGVQPGNGSPGSTVGITGSGFGSQAGSVTINGTAAKVTIWGDSTIAVIVPSIAAGNDTLSVSVPDAPSALTTAFTVDPVPTPAPTAANTPGQTPGSTPGSSPGSTPGSYPTINPFQPTNPASPTSSSIPTFIPPSGTGPIISINPVPFKPAPQVSGPVNLVLKAAKINANPGSNDNLTITLTAFGKPVVGAPVDLLLVVVPGGDASLTPTKGVTNANGVVQGVLHLSKRPGEHIILARSGDYSDEIQVTGVGLTGTGGSSSTGNTDNSGLVGAISGGNPERTVVVGALLACLVLFLSGFGINIATARRSATAGAAAALPARRSVATTMVAIPVGAGAAAQFGMAMVVCSFGQLVAIIRRR